MKNDDFGIPTETPSGLKWHPERTRFRSKSDFGHLWVGLGPIFGRSWAFLGRFGSHRLLLALLGRSRAALGVDGGTFGDVFDAKTSEFVTPPNPPRALKMS